MLHGSLLYGDWTGDDVFASQAEPADFRTRVASFRPVLDGSGRRAAGAAGGGRKPPPGPAPTPFPAGLDLPPPFEGQAPVFVSYRRTDLPRIAPELRRLTGDGVPLWYDRGIEEGTEWDTVLEDKIKDAAMLLIFLSEAAVESRYCRREIKLADTLNKPLLVVLLERVELKHGLMLMLQHLQQLSASDGDYQARLRDALKRMLKDGGRA